MRKEKERLKVILGNRRRRTHPIYTQTTNLPTHANCTHAHTRPAEQKPEIRSDESVEGELGEK